MSTDKLNVIIVGGGIIGCCTAYYLARQGAKVTLLERGALCSEASSTSAGLVTASTREGVQFSMVSETMRLLREVEAEAKIDFEFRQTGNFTLLQTEEDLSKQRPFVERQRAMGVDIQLLDRDATLELEPAVSPEILGSVYSPIDCTVSPYALTLAFGQLARRLGTDIRTGVEVTALKAEGNRVRTAITNYGRITGDLLVLAAGAWSPALARTIGLDVPIEPSRGQVVITESGPPIIRRIVRDTGHIYVRPTFRGNYLMGSLTERVGFNKKVTQDRLRDYVRESAKLVPAVRGIKVMRAWAGLRPLSPDDVAFLGPVPGYEGLVVATGHSRTGIGFSAVTSKMVADFITTGSTDFPLDPFSIGRLSSATNGVASGARSAGTH